MSFNKAHLLLQAIILISLNSQLIGMQDEHSAQAILANPGNYLKKINNTVKAYSSDYTNINRTLPTFRQDSLSCVKKHEQMCPLFLLDESTLERNRHDGTIRPSILSRITYPTIRESFEKRATDLLCNKIHEAQGCPVTYTDFGHDQRFQTLMIIAKALMIHPTAHLNIHIIDKSTATFLYATDYLNNSREIKPDDTFLDLTSHISDFAQYIRTRNANNSDVTQASDEKLQQDLTLLCLNEETQYKQFIKWLTQQFPESKLALYCHGLPTAYCEFLQKNNLDHADVVTASDTNDRYNYAELCQTTLTQKPTSNNAWLMKLANKNGQFPVIATFSLATADDTVLIPKSPGTEDYMTIRPSLVCVCEKL